MILPAGSVTDILFLIQECYHFLIHATHAQLNEINDDVIYIEIDMWEVIFCLTQFLASDFIVSMPFTMEPYHNNNLQLYHPRGC